MVNKKIIFPIILIVAVLLVIGFYIFNSNRTNNPDDTKNQNNIIINLGNGMSEIPYECYQFRDNNFDPSYLGNLTTHIIEGTIKKVESKWKDEEKQIVTYTDFTIENYVKGDQLLNNEIQFVSLGGAIGNNTQWVEDSPIFTEGKRVRIYMNQWEYNNETRYGVVCSQLGIREI